MADGLAAPDAWLDTPIGALALWVDGDGRLFRAWFDDAPAGAPAGGAAEAAARLMRYFAGDLGAVDDLPVAPAGAPFHRAVWEQLRRIPAGRTASYADIARRLGGAASGTGPNARAVGTANARNPVAVVIPCHRVIGSDGRLTGYAGGLWRKEWLLRHEGWAPMQGGLL